MPLRLCLVLLFACCVASQFALSAQEAEDRTAFRAARAVSDPGERIAALGQFAQQYHESALRERAEEMELEAYLQSFPDRTPEIHALAAEAIASAPAGMERWSRQARIADQLADAGNSGADLPDARRWAEAAVGALTEQSFRHEMLALQARYRLGRLTPRQLHHDFIKKRAAFLAALANVDLREGRQDAAERALAEAYPLDPLSSEGNSLRAQLALLRKQDAAALGDFEKAEAASDLPPRWHEQMVRLFAEQHRAPSGSTMPMDAASKADLETQMNRDIDALYERLFPPVFALPAHKLPAGGHTALLELFTGSGCEPCAAPDLAMDSLLRTYGRQDLVVLEYDEHIPRPDPLANPDSVARAAVYGVEGTPAAFLDGEPLPVAGAAREDTENVVVGFAEAIEDRARDPSPWQLALTLEQGSEGAIRARAAVTAHPISGQRQVAPTHGPVLHLAFVEDHVRYSGENGIRFHRMVVRKLARETRLQLAKGAGVAEADFQPAEIAAEQRLYLGAYEKSNDRFGPFQFRAHEDAMRPNQMAIVAWLEDAITHEVLQAAYAAVPAR